MTMVRHATTEEIFAMLDGIEPAEARALLELLDGAAEGGFVPPEDVHRWAAMLQVLAIDPNDVH